MGKITFSFCRAKGKPRAQQQQPGNYIIPIRIRGSRIQGIHLRAAFHVG